MKKIKLTQGKYALVDDKDFEWLTKFKWCNSHGYAVRRSRKPDGRYGLIFMHRQICKTPREMKTDHINSNPLDNRKKNLRWCTQRQNLVNRKKSPGFTSRYKGVHWDRGGHRWQAQISENNKSRYIGSFQSERAAAIAYDKEAVRIYGQFAKPNFNA